MKGGVGKSSLAYCLGLVFSSLSNLRTAIVDLESNATLSSLLKSSSAIKSRSSALSVFTEVIDGTNSKLGLIQARNRVMKSSLNADVLIADMTWGLHSNPEIVGLFDVLLIPTGDSDIEMDATLQFISLVAPVLANRVRLLVVPTRHIVRNNFAFPFDRLQGLAGQLPISITAPIPFNRAFATPCLDKIASEQGKYAESRDFVSIAQNILFSIKQKSVNASPENQDNKHSFYSSSRDRQEVSISLARTIPTLQRFVRSRSLNSEESPRSELARALPRYLYDRPKGLKERLSRN
jgi:cellulose biosynthesis protein BcsQ